MVCDLFLWKLTYLQCDGALRSFGARIFSFSPIQPASAADQP